jgi:hypothetical protein
MATNEGVFRFLGTRREGRGAPPVASLDASKRNYYWDAGAHPEIVERLWDQLGKNLPPSSRALVFGTPALVHRESGVVLAFALGTAYAVRLPREVLETGRPDGARSVTRWSGGGSTDIARECGEDWVFGSFAAAESAWCEAVFRECGSRKRDVRSVQRKPRTRR